MLSDLCEKELTKEGTDNKTFSQNAFKKAHITLPLADWLLFNLILCRYFNFLCNCFNGHYFHLSAYDMWAASFAAAVVVVLYKMQPQKLHFRGDATHILRHHFSSLQSSVACK